MMGSSEKFCLKWNEFQENVSKSFSQLRQQSGLFDVTLVSSDQKQVSAHRLVLSACSEFFKNIFNNNNSHSHPLLYLDGVDHSEINLMLDYIYQGEVQIYQEHLDRFLDVAKKFKLEGLMAEVEGKSEPDFEENFPPYHEETLEPVEPVDEANTAMKMKVHDRGVKISEAPAMKSNVQDRSVKILNESFEASNSEVENKFLELIVKENDTYRCTVCDKTQSHKTKMRLHLESHLTGLSYDCPTCGKNFRLRNTLNLHVSRKHNKA